MTTLLNPAVLTFLVSEGFQIVSLIFHKDGTKTAIVHLSDADANFDANIAQVNAALEAAATAKPSTPAAP